MDDISKLCENVATVVGVIDTIELKQGTAKTSGNAYTFLAAEIKAGNSKVKVDVWGTKRKPLLPTETHAKFKVGDLIVAQGSVQEQVADDGKIYRRIRAWRFDPANTGSEQKAVYHAVGHLGHAEVGDDREKLVPITVVRSYETQDGDKVQNEDTLRLSPEPEVLKTLYEKVAEGRLIRVRGDMISQVIRDRYEMVTGYRQSLTADKIEVYDEANEMWLTVSTEMPVVIPAAAAPVAAGAEDDFVPF